MTYFKDDRYCFKMSIPEYEFPVFGFNVGELRLVDNIETGYKLLPLSEFQVYLKEKEIKICTFRGKENIKIIRLLENIGFKFVSTFCIAECYKDEFHEIKNESNYKISLADPTEFNEILDISSSVSDFSTFSVDPLIEKIIISKRNAARTRSIFTKENHRVYVIKIDNKIAGFIQFIADVKNRRVYTQSAAVYPEFQKMKLGESLFSGTCKLFFQEGFEVIINNSYSTQNIGSYKLHRKCNFKIVDQEIHLRYFSE